MQKQHQSHCALLPLMFDVTLTVFFGCVFLGDPRLRKKEGEERNSYYMEQKQSNSIDRSLTRYSRSKMFAHKNCPNLTEITP